MKNVQYISSDIFTPKDSWGALSMQEKAAIIRAGVEEGLTDLSQIRAKYNEFAEGGQSIPADWQKKQFQDGGIKPTAAPIDSAFMASRPNPWDIAARTGLNYSNTVLGHEFPITEEVPVLPAPIDRDEVRQRQAFMETEFNDKAVSSTGAMGRWQIMPNTLAEYTKKTGRTGDLVNPEFNAEVRDWYIDNLLDRSWVTKGEAPDSVQWGKALAAYNYGPTNVVNTLNKAKREGIDIYSGWDWLSYMPEETRNYVNFTLRNQDVNKYKTQERYDRAVKKLNKKEYGGPLVQQANI